MVKNKIKPKRKITRRICTGCRKIKEKKEMLRIVRTQNGDIKYDLKGKMPGRGAYVCYDISCVESAFSKKGLSKTLKKDIPSSLIDDIINIISKIKEKK